MRVTLPRGLGRLIVPILLLGLMSAAPAAALAAQPDTLPATAQAGGEANLVVPDLSTVDFLGGVVNGRSLLMGGLAVCALGLLFGLLTFTQLRNLPVHPAMREVSELIYETCKTYLVTQGKFTLPLELFIGVIIAFYYGVLERLDPVRVVIILLFS